jgi:C-terminal processing protease CtpA/Prc
MHITKTGRDLKILSIIALLFWSLPVFCDSITQAQKTSLVNSLTQSIGSNYVLTENIGDIELSLRSLQAQPNFQVVSTNDELAGLLTEELQKHDKHFVVQWRDVSALSEKQKVKEGWFAKLKRKNSGFNKVEILEGNVGYIDFWGFADLNGTSREKVESVMDFVSEVDALIIDLRANGGGSAEMVQMISSYFFDKKTHLNSFYSRQTGAISEFWTFDDIEGVRMPELPLYILTSSKTFSAAEEFAYNFKHLQRATIIGEPTKGGANPWGYVDLVGGFRAAIPNAKAINPITKTNWEGVGVTPNIRISSKEALDKAYQLALETVKKSDIGEYQQKEIEIKLAELMRNKAGKAAP